MELTKVIDGYLHVQYLPPCEIVPSPAEWVAPMKLTDLHSGSYVYLNRDGTAKASPKPVYLTEQGKATLEAALKDSSVVEQIVDRPECPEIYKRVNVGEPRFCGGLDGRPDHDAENIGDPAMPKAGLSSDDPTRGTCMGNGWVGSYCWPMGEEAYSLHALEGETIAQFPKPDIPEGLYLMIASYESPLGEVEYGFKVELKDRRVKE